MASRQLHVGQGLSLPLQMMTQSAVVYGTRGSGKSTLGRKIAEEVANQGQRFCAVDPTGAWWGLKSSASGTDVGLPVVIFGGDHADVPLESSAGSQLADIVAEIDQSVILDLELLSKGKQVVFLGAFLERLYHVNRDPLLLLLDEAQRYAPQRPMNPDAAKTLGAAEDIVKLGRKHGLGAIVFTQRGSGLNKEVSELADILIAFRTPGVLDQSRIKEWLEANATAEQAKQVMSSVSGLPTGTAIFASNHPSLRLFTTTAVDLPLTFDSSATPAVGQRRKEPRILAKPDLDALSKRMAEAIERAKADDPKELHRKIAGLERLVASQDRAIREIAETQAPIVMTEIKLVSVLDEMDHQLVQDLIDGLEAVATQVGPIRDLLTSRLAEIDSPVAASVAIPAKPAPPIRHASQPDRHLMVVPVPSNGEAKLGKAERQILFALQQHADGLTRVQLAFLTGYSPRTSTLGVALARLRSEGLVTKGGDLIDLTEVGHKYPVGDVDRLPEPGPDLVAYWSEKLGKAEREVLRVMVEAYPDQLSRNEIAERTGYSPQTSTLGVALARVRGLKLVDGFCVSADLIGR